VNNYPLTNHHALNKGKTGFLITEYYAVDILCPANLIAMYYRTVITGRFVVLAYTQKYHQIVKFLYTTVEFYIHFAIHNQCLYH